MFRSYRKCFRFSDEFSINLYICIMYEYFDKDLGKIIVKRDGRKRRCVITRTDNYFLMTIPTRFPLKEVPKLIEDNKPDLLKLTPTTTPIIDENTIIKTLTFSVKIIRTSLFDDKIKMTLSNGVLTIAVPESADIKSDNVQRIIREMIKAALRNEAKRVLPKKTMNFAKKLGLQVSQVKINSSKGRWGSCSNKGAINLSLYLMLLEERYIDYIILHELAHRIHMSHDDNFWDLLSKFCGEDARKIRDEMKHATSHTRILMDAE